MNFYNVKNNNMGKISFKTILGCMLIAFLAMMILSCNLKTPKEDVKMQSKLEKNEVPKEVTDAFSKDYPIISDEENWYGYPSYGDKLNWYDNWFEYGPYSKTKYPEYYEVEFTKDSILNKAIYLKTGGKIAIHKSLKSDIPQAISDSISKGEYIDWKLGKEKEEIFKGSDKDQL